MANNWVFRTSEGLKTIDIGDGVSLMDFIKENPTLGVVRRGVVEDPYTAPTSTMGDQGEVPVVEQSDPTSAEPAFKATTPPPPPSGEGRPDSTRLQDLLPLEYQGLSLEQVIQKAKQAIDQGLFEERSYGTPFDLTALNNLAATLIEAGESAAADSLVTYFNTPVAEGGGSGKMAGFANPDAFSPENRFGVSGYIDEDGNYFSGSYQFMDPNSEVGANLNKLQEATSTLTPAAKIQVDAFANAMQGPLFDESGNPIFPELPMEVFGELLQNEDIALAIGPIFETLLDSRSAAIQNATSNRAMVEAAEAQYNPFSRTAAGDRSLQDMLAQREIERTKAQFNPFDLTTAQGVKAIQDQFNPYMQDAADRLALAQAQFNPYDQSAANRTALISAQFNPYNFSQAQGLEGISRQFNPYGETAADRLALARMAANPFDRSQVQDQQLQALLARGGLSASERLAEIQASNNPMNTQNLLTFLANPSAVGTAVQLGGQGFLNQLTGGQGIPQAAPSPQQMMPPPPSPAPMTPTPTGSADYSFNVANPMSQPMMTEADLAQQTEEEQAMSIGAAAAQGLTPAAFKTEVREVTPWGIDTNRGLL